MGFISFMMGRHKLKSASGYVSKNGYEWDSNPCPHQPVTYLAGLHDQNKSGFFAGPAFIQPIKAT